MQGKLLALTYLHPDREYSLTEAAALVGASVKAVHQEASRLVEAGLLADRRVGTARLVRVAGSPIQRQLTELIAVTYGPLPVLTDALRSVAGVHRAFIYGSWAARYHGEPGPVPADVDVLVVGTARRDDLDEVARSVEPILGRMVNIRRVKPAAWDAGDATDTFLATVRNRPLVELQVDGPEANGRAAAR
ncbi:MAG TPA: helix-turn-helix domain-containing protein [Actinomycetes bacterium]|nr:helix-turn-helix domain-containing protein [Actinomycetes bacterium]